MTFFWRWNCATRRTNTRSVCVLCVLSIGWLARLLTGTAAKEGGIGLKNVLRFHPSFWLLSISCVAVYATVLPFNNIAQAFLFEKFLCPGPDAADGGDCPVGCLPTCADRLCSTGDGTDAYAAAITKVGLVMSIPYWISACSSPFLGGAVDKFGHRVMLTTIAALVLVIVHVAFPFRPNGDKNLLVWMYLPLIGQGCAYSIYASSLWPSVQATVQQHEVGMAYGVVTAIQNGGMALFPQVCAGQNRTHRG